MNNSRKNIEPIIKQLYGRKFLIMGNHDRNKSIDFWLSLGFEEVYKNPIIIDGILFSHEPQEHELNIHGHIHEKRIEGNYINVCVERIGYTPIKLSKVLEGY